MTELVIIVCNVLGVVAALSIGATLVLLAMGKVHG